MEPEVLTREQYWGDFEPKKAEVANTHLMPGNAPMAKGPDKGAKAPITKTGSALEEYLLKGAAEAPPPEGADMAGTSGEQPPSLPQAKPLNPRVNVGGKEAPKELKVKKASRFALPSIERYPLDSYTDAEKAVGYFEKFASQFTPRQRREFCQNLSGRADELGIKVGHEIRKYGSATYAPEHEIAAALDTRRLVVPEAQDRLVLDKLAAARPTLPADIFAESLSEFDRITGIDHLYGQAVIDPFYATFGEKTASEDDGLSYIEGNDTVTNKLLLQLGRSPCEAMKKTFGYDFVEEFKKDPVGIFKSLPVDQKKLVSRMANDVEVG